MINLPSFITCIVIRIFLWECCFRAQNLSVVFHELPWNFQSSYLFLSKPLVCYHSTTVVTLHCTCLVLFHIRIYTQWYFLCPTICSLQYMILVIAGFHKYFKIQFTFFFFTTFTKPSLISQVYRIPPHTGFTTLILNLPGSIHSILSYTKSFMCMMLFLIELYIK